MLVMYFSNFLGKSNFEHKIDLLILSLQSERWLISKGVAAVGLCCSSYNQVITTTIMQVKCGIYNVDPFIGKMESSSLLYIV
jgi:hypothetical protein